MINVEQTALVLEALPDPAFILSRSGKYVAVFGGRDARYYHDGSGLVGLRVSDVVKAEKANWFLEQIELALESGKLLIKEYELSQKDVKVYAMKGPNNPSGLKGVFRLSIFLLAASLWCFGSRVISQSDMSWKLNCANSATPISSQGFSTAESLSVTLRFIMKPLSGTRCPYPF